jgi:hypothetical protein
MALFRENQGQETSASSPTQEVIPAVLVQFTLQHDHDVSILYMTSQFFQDEGFYNIPENFRAGKIKTQFPIWQDLTSDQRVRLQVRICAISCARYNSSSN